VGLLLLLLLTLLVSLVTTSSNCSGGFESQFELLWLWMLGIHALLG
jgi:hypothetical protein